MASWGDGSGGGGWASPDDRSPRDDDQQPEGAAPSAPPRPPPFGYYPQPQPQPQPGYDPPQQPPPPPPGYTPGAGYGMPPPGYPQGPYGYTPYAAPKTEGTAVGALLCAILSWLTCFPVLAIVALPLASVARKRIELSDGHVTGEKLLAPAKWIAIAHIAVSALVIGGLVIALVGEIASDPEPTPEQFQLRVGLNARAVTSAAW